jgi:hypothetical protein
MRGESGISLADFTFAIGETLLLANKPIPSSVKKRGCPSSSSHTSTVKNTPYTKKRHQQPNEVARYDLVDHFPRMSEKQERCRQCANEGRRNGTNVMCIKCNTFLCFTRTRNCFHK